jgi:protein-disulfide isomerase
MLLRAAILSIPLMALMLFSGASRAQQDQSSFDPQQRQAIERIVEDFLLRNPEVIEEASKELERRREAQQQAAQAEALKQYRDKLLSPRGSTIIGNPNGKTDLVEFFDYNCPYCRKDVDDVKKLIQDNPDLRVVLREFPILGPDSVAASRVALAVAKQTDDLNLRSKFYHVLMGSKGRTGAAQALAVAAGLGLDETRLKKDMRDPDLDAIIRENLTLAEALAIEGTPSFVIGNQIIVGAVGSDRMQAAITAARK